MTLPKDILPRMLALKALAADTSREHIDRLNASVALSLLIDEHAEAIVETLERYEAALGRVRHWTHVHGDVLCPRGADTYGEGMRDAKRQVGDIISAALGKDWQ